MRSAAATGYARALKAAPDNPIVAVRAYRAALSAGDMALATRARAVLERADVAPSDAALLALAAAAGAGDSAAANAAIARIGAGPLDFLVAPLRAWSLVTTEPARAVATLDNAGKNPIGQHYAGETRALMLIASGRTDDGVAMLRVVLGGSRSSFDLRITAAQLLAGTGADRSGDGVARRAMIRRFRARCASTLGTGDQTQLCSLACREC